MLEYDVNQVVVSTMACFYFLVSLKPTQQTTGTGAATAGAASDCCVLRKIPGLGRWCIDLIRVPYYEQTLGAKNVYCGVENDAYVLVDFENEQTRLLQ